MNPARWPWLRRWFGARSERAGVRFLKKLGYRILACNYSCHLGELDIVALDRECIVFVEVRSTGSDDPLRPVESVDARKQRKLSRLATHFLQKYRLTDRYARFDILAIQWTDGQPEPRIDHYPFAFEAAD